MQFLGCLIAGAEAVVTERFRATSWLEEVRAAEATITNGLGVIPEFIFRQPPDRPRSRPPPAPDDGGADRARVGRGLRGALRGAVHAGVRHDRVQYRGVHAPGRRPRARAAPAIRWTTGSTSPSPIPPPTRSLPAGQTGEIVVRPKVPGLRHGRLLPDAREDRRGVAQPLVSHRRRRPLRRRGPPALRRPHQGLHPPAGREHLELRDRAGAQRPSRRWPSRRWSASRWPARAARTR